MIADSHCHLGYDPVFDEDFTRADLLESQERNSISLSLVQPAVVHDLETVRRYHDDIADFCSLNPGRFKGIANPNPHLPGDGYEAEIRRCVKELGFVGIKLHPFGHAVNPLGADGRQVFEIASGLDVPVLVHTGVGIPWSSPALMEEAAEKYPGLRIVLCHAGGLFSAEAGSLARKYPNIFLELSWQSDFVIQGWTKDPGADRLMFGSDHASNAALEIVKIRSLKLKKSDEETILSGTCLKVFGL